MIRISGNSGCGKTMAAQAAIDTNNPAHIIIGNDAERWIQYNNDTFTVDKFFRGKSNSQKMQFDINDIISHLRYRIATKQQLPKTLVLDETLDMNSLHILRRLFPLIFSK